MATFKTWEISSNLYCYTYGTIKLTEKTNKGFESGKYTGLISIDLQHLTQQIMKYFLKMGCIGFSEK